MKERIKIAIAGYGNLGKGVEKAVNESPDMQLVGVFTRRNPEEVSVQTKGIKVLPAEALDYPEQLIERPDVLAVCGGSAKDLPWQSPHYAKLYNLVDSFDHHAAICDHFEKVDQAAKCAGTVAVIAAGWDPGLFSYHRALAKCVMPEGSTYTFWGKGISQGHSDAVRGVEGVIDARQYTLPKMELLEEIRSGREVILPGNTQMHERECFVVAEAGADEETIKEKIIHMPDYFAGYKTKVNFISQEDLQEKHSKMPHGGTVIRQAGDSIYEFSLKLRSNPEFTASVLTAYARAAYRISKEGGTGCRTIFEIPLTYIAHISHREMIKNFL